MGCVVNGPGESKHANIGISLPGTGETPVAPVYVDGDAPGVGINLSVRQLREPGLVGSVGELLHASGLPAQRRTLEMLRELEAQIRTLSRRLKLFPPCAPAAPRAAGNHAGWTYDAVGWTVLAPDGQAVKLTANERVFMSLLVERPGEPVSRDDIFKALGKRQWDPSDRSVDSMVRRLRAKAQDTLGCELPIEAVHGTGYAFAAPIAVI